MKCTINYSVTAKGVHGQKLLVTMVSLTFINSTIIYI